METVADLRFLEVAQVRVKAQQIAIGVTGEAGIEIESRVFGEVEDVAFEPVAAAAVHPLGEVVFIDQSFKVPERSIGLGAGEWWCQVIDDYRTGAAFGLRSFARVIDDERIELRQGAVGDFRIALRRERSGLAR